MMQEHKWGLHNGFPDQPPSYYNFTEETFVDNIVFTVQGTKVKLLNYNGSVNHPMHMHGYSFYVVGSGYGNYDDEDDPKGLILLILLKVWFWHCHFDRHLSWGMNTAFIVKNGGTSETNIRRPQLTCLHVSLTWILVSKTVTRIFYKKTEQLLFVCVYINSRSLRCSALQCVLG
ncbi:putative laccase [Rosa chinensis]|uniref:Putative laccase n=1 Tax=Rosa chinensis TaxID=74649 RepID=A0A2P6PL25_ROSCH|nr:putative laccase [Rosa chinensis]